MFVTFSFQNVRSKPSINYNGKIINVIGSYEYLVERFDEWGAQGWEFTNLEGGTIYLFKRPV
jgi:hypothetical protein